MNEDILQYDIAHTFWYSGTNVFAESTDSSFSEDEDNIFL
jgi:hypothetical protein